MSIELFIILYNSTSLVDRLCTFTIFCTMKNEVIGNASLTLHNISAVNYDVIY